MPLAHVSLGAPQFIPANPTALLINPVGFKTFCKEIILHNTGTLIETIEVWEVAGLGGSLGSSALSNRLMKIVLNPDDTVFVGFADVLILDDEFDAIFAKCSTASKVVIKFEGDMEDV